MALPGARAPAPRRVRRLVHKADFVCLLNVPAQERSAHFAVHHVASAPLPLRRPPLGAKTEKLCTEGEQLRSQDVDNCQDAVWIGCVVPKRHARRSVTRSLLKRQIRAALERQSTGLAKGLWLVRLRSAFAPKLFVAAASTALADAVRSELDALLARACVSAPSASA